MICHVMVHNADNDTILKHLRQTQLLYLFQRDITPLHLSVCKGYTDVINVLLMAGADPEAKKDVSERMSMRIHTCIYLSFFVCSGFQYRLDFLMRETYCFLT